MGEQDGWVGERGYIGWGERGGGKVKGNMESKKRF